MKKSWKRGKDLKMGVNKRLKPKICKMFKDSAIIPSPVLSAQLDQVDSMQLLISQLWEQTATEPLFTTYTNKAGATNATASAALKELRQWQTVYTSATRSLFRMIQTELNAEQDDLDGLEEFL